MSSVPNKSRKTTSTLRKRIAELECREAQLVKATRAAWFANESGEDWELRQDRINALEDLLKESFGGSYPQGGL